MRFFSKIVLVVFAVLFIQGVPANAVWEGIDSQEQAAICVAVTTALSTSSTQESPKLLSPKRHRYQAGNLSMNWTPTSCVPGHPLSSLRSILRC